MIAAFALILAAQAPAQQAPQRADPTPMRPLDPIDGSDTASPWTSTPEARQQAAKFGACIADASTAKATATLRSDFRTATYRNAMRTLSDNNNSCFQRRGRMRVSNLLLAGAIAERLMTRDTVPLGKRLALAAGRPAVTTYAPSDAAALCVVRSDPDDIAKLIASAPASDDERKLLPTLRGLIGRCAGKPVEGSDEGLRAMLATAAFRSVAADGKTS